MSESERANPLEATFEFFHQGHSGCIAVTCAPSIDPPSIGNPEQTRGFPHCTARIDFQAGGYDAFFGWIQLVRSSDNKSRGAAFEIDPLGWFPDSRSPYAFFGLLPTLFDAPSRGHRKPMEWVAHSYLATTPSYNQLERALGLRKVVWVAGFSWGFRISPAGSIELLPIAQTAGQEWNRVVPVLQRQFPSWKFLSAGSPP